MSPIYIRGRQNEGGIFMSDDKKTEKQIDSYGKHIKVWLNEIEKII